MKKHSPGPWTVRQRAGKPFITKGNCTKGESVALIQAGLLEDAHLIAAAPELLEMLKRLSTISTMNPTWDEEILVLIQKAEGK